jgi:NADPH:quinone reductase-like Zn-dependent oxidoreductase
VLAVGQSVKDFKIGDKVCTHLAPHMRDDEIVTFTNTSEGLGQTLDGTLAEYGVLHKSALVHMPPNLSFEQASTLTCSALTAWNALSSRRNLQKGDIVLTQGTGGVSIAALQVSESNGESPY